MDKSRPIFPLALTVFFARLTESINSLNSPKSPSVVMTSKTSPPSSSVAEMHEIINGTGNEKDSVTNLSWKRSWTRAGTWSTPAEIKDRNDHHFLNIFNNRSYGDCFFHSRLNESLNHARIRFEESSVLQLIFSRLVENIYRGNQSWYVSIHKIAVSLDFMTHRNGSHRMYFADFENPLQE